VKRNVQTSSDACEHSSGRNLSVRAACWMLASHLRVLRKIAAEVLQVPLEIMATGMGLCCPVVGFIWGILAYGILGGIFGLLIGGSVVIFIVVKEEIRWLRLWKTTRGKPINLTDELETSTDERACALRFLIEQVEKERAKTISI